MKNIYLILIAIFVAFACEQEEFEGSGLESLRDFELSPVSGARIELNSVAPDEKVVISWNEARSGFNSPVSYTWLVDEVDGDFSSPLLSLPSDEDGTDTQVSLTNEEFDQALAALGLKIGEEIEVKWTVSATNGDLTKVAEPNTITLKRYVDEIASFALVSPENGAFIELDIDNPESELVAVWEKTFSGLGSSITYEWVADESGSDFSTPLFKITSNNEGTDTTATLTHGFLDEAFANLGKQMGEITSLEWKVIAKNKEFVKESEIYSLDIRRFDTKVDFKIVLNVSSADVPSGFDVFVAGQFDKLGLTPNEWQQPGTNSDLQLSYNADNDNYELNFRVAEDKLGITFEFKYYLATTAAPSWSYGEQVLNSSGCEGVPNRIVTFLAPGQTQDDEVTVWEGYCPQDPGMRFTVTVPESTPTEYDVYISGDLGVAYWPQPGTDDRLKMKKISDFEYELYLPVPSGHVGEFKYFLATKTAPSWDNGEQKINGTGDGCEGMDNRPFTFDVDSAEADAQVNTVDAWQGFCPF